MKNSSRPVQWNCFELHSHTLHSDGVFTPAELRSAAKEFLYDGIALTDHNTQSALDELSGVEQPGAVPVIPGIEWTTYYGHMLVIGAEKYVDWRFATPDTIDEYTAKVKKAGGVTGIAHPFNLGSPMCTGCYWDFKVRDWNNIDYIEVWSEPFPHKHLKNEIAFSWWTSLLNEGHHIAASSGRDWHRREAPPVLPAATWLGLSGNAITVPSVKEALGAGRTIVSIGPFPEIALSRKDGLFYPGDTVEAGSASLSVSVDETRRSAVWASFGIRTRNLRLVHNGKPLQSVSLDSSLAWEGKLDLSPGWFRVEGYGDLEGKKETLLFFSSPWYIS